MVCLQVIEAGKLFWSRFQLILQVML